MESGYGVQYLYRTPPQCHSSSRLTDRS